MQILSFTDSKKNILEYSLVKGVNDSPECAKQLIKLVHGMNCHINLIPVNPIKERDYEQSEKNSIHNLKKY